MSRGPIRRRLAMTTILALLLLSPTACGEAPRESEQSPADTVGIAADVPDDRSGAEDRREGEDDRPGTHAVYVPAYSHIYHHVGDAFLLATTLSIRNTDPRDSLTVTSVRYYHTDGQLVRHNLRDPRTLGPLQSMEFVVEEQDVSGGSGANFIVEWRAEGAVNPPVVEAVMISTRSGQGISFTSRGVPIETPEE